MGPLAGVPYDGMQTIADGTSKWWNGLDPQMLNGRPHETGTPCPKFVRQFLLRVQDVIDKYGPDILTFDDGAQFNFDYGMQTWLGIPDLAPQIMAYYNTNVRAHGGRLEGVVDLKEVPEPIWGTLTRDFEMALSDKLQEKPWQTEACIGNWHYDRRLLENHSYQKASLIIPLLVDIVSKNGNLLDSIPLPGHGEPDSDEVAFLNELADGGGSGPRRSRGHAHGLSTAEALRRRPNDPPSYQLSGIQIRLCGYPLHDKRWNALCHRVRKAAGWEVRRQIAG